MSENAMDRAYEKLKEDAERVIELPTTAYEAAKERFDAIGRSFKEFPDQAKMVWEDFGEDLGEDFGKIKKGLDAFDPDARDSDGKPLNFPDRVKRVADAIKTFFKLLKTGTYVPVALLTGPLAALYGPRPAATLGCMYLGLPHAHGTPPRPPGEPSIGMILIGPTPKVLINGMPAARAGDVGIAPTCGGFLPFFEVTWGSSKVFIGRARAARLGDIGESCAKPSDDWLGKAFSNTDKVADGAGVVAGYAGAMADAQKALERYEAGDSEAAIEYANAAITGAAQTVVDAQKMTIKVVMGKDPAITPSIGAVVTGSPFVAGPIPSGFLVLIGGFPLPSNLILMPRQISKLIKLKALGKGAPAKSAMEGCPTCSK